MNEFVDSGEDGFGVGRWQDDSDDDHAVAVGVAAEAAGVVMAPIACFVAVGAVVVEEFGDGGGEAFGGAVVGEVEELLFVVLVGPAGEGAGFGVRDVVGGEGGVDEWEVAE